MTQGRQIEGFEFSNLHWYIDEAFVMENGYKYLFPYEKVAYGSKIVIYGAGILGQEYLTQILMTKYCNIIAFLDKRFEEYNSSIVPVYPPEKIRELDYDKIVIALRNDHAYREVKRILIENNVSKDDLVCVFQREEIKYDFCPSIKANFFQNKYAFEKSKLSIALYCIGGFGDAIIQKKFIETLLLLMPNSLVDIYHLHADAYLPHIYNLEGNINIFINDNGVLYNKMRQRYALGITVRGYFLEVDNYDENSIDAVSVNSKNKIKQLARKIKGENFTITTPAYVGFMRRVYRGNTCYTGYGYDGILDIKDYKVEIPLRKKFYKKYIKLELNNYVTVNSGNGDSDDYKMVAKSWPPSYFDKTIKLLKKKYPRLIVVQVSGKRSHKIEGVDKYFLGEDMELVKYILKNAIFHLDIEGGLVHLATQLGTKCMVLFGPTNPRYVGYKENINITAGSCHDCYGIYTDINCCAKGMDKPECMYRITPEIVLEKIEEYMNEIEKER